MGKDQKVPAILSKEDLRLLTNFSKENPIFPVNSQKGPTVHQERVKRNHPGLS